MKTYTFDTIQQIQDFKFLTDSSGVLLDKTGKLYAFTGNQLQPIQTPPGFTVSHFHFSQDGRGAVVGNNTAPGYTIYQGALSTPWLLLFFLAAFLLRNQLVPPTRRCFAAVLCLAVGSSLLTSCGGHFQQYLTADPTSRFTTWISSNQLGRGGAHYYVGNKKQQAFIALTSTHGQTWTTHRLPTNFYVTALAALGENFLVGTYANDQEGVVPIHGDGDLWLYGNEATYAPRLADNTPQKPYEISLRRGVNGFAVYPADSLVFAFGSETMPVFPKSEISVTQGNIYALPTSLQPPFRIIDVPDSVAVHSLAKSSAGELWVTLEDRKMHVVQGRTIYRPLATKQLLRFQQGRWVPQTIAGFHSFEQVEFVRGTSRGYVLTATGEVLATRDNGGTWQAMALQTIRLVHAGEKHVGFLRGTNQLLVD